MTNNSPASQRKAEFLISARQRLDGERRDAGNYRELARILEIKHHSYISNFVKHGWIPNIDAQKKMGIYQLSKSALEYRRANLKAKAKGYKNWNAYKRAVIKGEAEIPQNDV